MSAVPTDPLVDHWAALIKVTGRIQAIVVGILAFIVLSMAWIAVQRTTDTAELRRSLADAARQIAGITATVEGLAKEEAMRKAENERSKLDRAQLNARQAKAEDDRRRIETGLRQIAEIRAIVERLEARKP